MCIRDRDRGYIEAFDVEIGRDDDAERLGSETDDAEVDSDDEENVRRGV